VDFSVFNSCKGSGIILSFACLD